MVRTGASVAAAYGWTDMSEAGDLSWRLEAHHLQEIFAALQEQLNQLNVDDDKDHSTESQIEATDPVLLRVVKEPW
jgi:hypothetical protein